MIPLFDFRRPCIPGDSKWSDHQYLANEKGIEAQIEDGGEGNCGFAGPKPISRNIAAMG